jgi:hypothetical protein
MKHLFTVALFVALVVLAPCNSFAQRVMRTHKVAGTVLNVYASGDFLNNVINADLASASPATEYNLVSTDTTYVFNGPITASTNLKIIGVVNPTTKRPPCIQPFPLADQSIPGNLFVLNGNGTVGTFKNIYLLGLSTTNQPAGTGTTSGSASGTGIQVSADSITIVADNCIFEQWLGFGIGTSGSWTNLFVTNSVFRNMAHPNQYYVGEAFRNEWSADGTPMDSIVMNNNTFLCLNGYASCPVTKQICTYFEFCHNDVIYTAKNPLFIFDATTAKINNNIFYGTYAIGVNFAENPWWDNLAVPDTTYSVIAFQPLLSVVATQFGAGESARAIEVKNNNCYWPSGITSFWTTLNSTYTWASGSAILTPTWMNDRTLAMFADKAGYPLLTASGNTFIDPGFGPTIGEVLAGGGSYGAGMVPWMTQIRQNASPSVAWGYQLTVVDSLNPNWIPQWPLPEKTALNYSATLVATEGLAVGDPNMKSTITGVATTSTLAPTKFALSAAYPNPFNPSTHIDYTLNKSGITSLKVYNVLGQVVKTLVNDEFQAANTYKLSVDMSSLTSGIYFCVLVQGNNRVTQKLVLLK